MKRPHYIIGVYCLLLLSTVSVFAQGRAIIPNPIIFCTQVPMPFDSSTCTAVFCNHQASIFSAVRGGDLWIIYPDGTTKNLTQLAGYGSIGAQGANSIAVRQPCVHWSGKKALFSMVIGGPASIGAQGQYYWQIYEVSGLGKNENPVITKVAKQPATYNNISPIYGTDGRIIFTSDMPHAGRSHLYPLLDEYRGAQSVTGLWSLDTSSGDIFEINNTPSGAFTPFIDSYGRLIFTRWDHLQRDGNADADALGKTHNGTFNYSDESAAATVTSSVTEVFPEPQNQRQDLLAGTNINGMEFNQFFPWQINEDGTSEETLNHSGRHDFRFGIGASINDDPNVVNLNYATAGRLNSSTFLSNFIQISEDPTHAGTYYGIDCGDFGTHGSGQILKISGAPTLDPGQMSLTYITDKTTSSSTQEGKAPAAANSGKYRNPLVLSNGKLIAAHTSNTFDDRNIGTAIAPQSRFDFRLKTLKQVGGVWIPDSLITPGFSKLITYWDPDKNVSYNGALWEIDPVEVRPRSIPLRRVSTLPSPEAQVFAEEGIDEAVFRDDLKQKGMALIVSRNVTHRDKTDHQQPFYLKVHNSTTQTPNSSGKVYDAAHLQLYQADNLRGYHFFGSTQPSAGRRVLPVFMHDAAIAHNPVTAGEQPYTVKVASDGSVASFVPTRRPITWAVVDSDFNAVVRERYWITAQPGEIRVCASCHGTNDEATTNLDPAPQNKPEALRTLLKYWKANHTPIAPPAPALVSPAYDSTGVTISHPLVWKYALGATSYHVQLSKSLAMTFPLLNDTATTATFHTVSGLEYNTKYYWRVSAKGDGGPGPWSDIWSFTTSASPVPPDIPVLYSPANDTSEMPLSHPLLWQKANGATSYRVQLSTSPTLFPTVLLDTSVTSLSCAPKGLAANNIYYWRVQASGDQGTSQWSTVWKFKTVTVAIAPGVPTLISPTLDSMNVSLTHPFVWNPVPAAVTYHLQVWKDPDFSKTIIDDSAISSSKYQWLQSFDYNSKYYWRVAAKNDGGAGPWSDVWRFTTIQQTDDVKTSASEPDFECYPNPADKKLTIMLKLREASTIRIRIFDLLGRERLAVAPTPYSLGIAYIEAKTDDLEEGTYYCRVECGTHSELHQIVVRH